MPNRCHGCAKYFLLRFSVHYKQSEPVNYLTENKEFHVSNKCAESGSALSAHQSGEIADSLKNGGGSIWLDSTLSNRALAT